MVHRDLFPSTKLTMHPNPENWGDYGPVSDSGDDSESGDEMDVDQIAQRAHSHKRCRPPST